jgi:hypothetical protein
LRIEVLPVFERLGDALERALALWKIGDLMLEVEPLHRSQARGLLVRANATLTALKLPQARALALRMREVGMAPLGSVAPADR